MQNNPTLPSSTPRPMNWCRLCQKFIAGDLLDLSEHHLRGCEPRNPGQPRPAWYAELVA